MKKKKTKVAFLDRDGVLNISSIKNGYIGYIKDFKWVSGAKRAIKLIKKNNYKVVIVTNQSGIARGYFSLRDVYKLHRFLKNELIKFGTSIDKVYFCPYHKDGIIKKYKKNSMMRKPNNGMFIKASKVWRIDKKNSFMIGDQKTDIDFAIRSKIKGYLFNKKNLYDFVKNQVLKNFL
tara:strand:- start:4511 stop:5041 length:531 start_codon:yes stop_codon:yes gene_type:complete